MFGGIKVKNKRGLCSVDKIEILSQQSVVKIHALQSKIIVKESDKVKKGTLIAEYNGAKSPNIFSSISGIVKRINKNEIIIENDFKNDEEKFSILKNPTSKQIIKRIKDAGIVGLGGSGFCTDLKYNKKLHTILINAVECENYLNCDETVLKVHTKQVFEGMKLLKKLTNANRIILCLQKRNKKYLSFLKTYLYEYNCEVAFVTNKYGVGAEKILIKDVLKINLSDEEYPYEKGIVVNNIQTIWSVFKACKLGMPLTERVVSVSGLSIKNPANYLIPNGATVENICKDAGGLKFDYVQMEDYKYSAILIIQNIEGLKDKIIHCENVDEKRKLKEKLNIERYKLKTEIKAVRKEKLRQYRLCLSLILLGGYFMGKGIEDIEDSINLVDGGVLFLSNLEYKRYESKRCINCKKCVKVCPKKLRPELINKNIDLLECMNEKNEKIKVNNNIQNLNINSCFNCGCCTYVCPSKINLKEKFENYKHNKYLLP